MFGKLILAIRVILCIDFLDIGFEKVYFVGVASDEEQPIFVTFLFLPDVDVASFAAQVFRNSVYLRLAERVRDHEDKVVSELQVKIF